MKWLKEKIKGWLFSEKIREEYEEPNENIMNVIDEDEDLDDLDGLEDHEREMVKKFLGSINFTILSDGQILICCNWVNADPTTAEIFGKFLFAINDGRLTSNITNYLIDFGGQDIRLAKFVTEILQSWKKVNEEQNNAPVVCPTQTFRLNREMDIEEE